MELQFRIWDGKKFLENPFFGFVVKQNSTKVNIYNEYFGSIKQNINEANDVEFIESKYLENKNGKEYEIEKSSGLLDGRLQIIYEGDFILFDGEEYIVGFVLGCFCLAKIEEMRQKELKNVNWVSINYYILEKSANNLQEIIDFGVPYFLVIGNIHEGYSEDYKNGKIKSIW